MYTLRISSKEAPIEWHMIRDISLMKPMMVACDPNDLRNEATAFNSELEF